ncbi:probable salivary secreted peptide [Eupeodes corollae]|uniref:probable salivary secreted peptide n=1 Tax=Eupeodes corollae TaxID=290404 RepID=UPI00248F4FF3|nr:probable salivary secreted peptide [Eupeodes corollae]
MKTFSVVLVLVALFAVGGYSLNATYGNVTRYSAVLARERVIKFPRNGQYLTFDVVFPKSGQTNNKTIGGIRVTDHFNNKTGAYSTLWSGGPGFRFATINLKSQLSRGINSTVEIYAK